MKQQEEAKTPRTDALIKWVNNDAPYKAPEQRPSAQVGYIHRLTELARTLERELESASQSSRQQIAEALRGAAGVCKGQKFVGEAAQGPQASAYNIACDHCAESLLALIPAEVEGQREDERRKGLASKSLWDRIERRSAGEDV